MKTIRIVFFALMITILSSCDYLDIVPDNVPTLENAFRMRSTAIKYLATCYSYLPESTQYNNSPLFGADEMWVASTYENVAPGWQIAAGLQNVNSPINSPWYGSKNLWEGISQCNIFLENIEHVPDMDSYEKERWSAEVKFLKAYFHFLLLKHFGPIPIKDKDLPISSSIDEVRMHRQPVDDVFDYIVNLMDEVIDSNFLPDVVVDETEELGRVTLPIVMGIKAKVLVYSASPLFNGNTEYANFLNEKGEPFFNQEYSEEKWIRAAEACKKAIDKCHEIGYELYEFEPDILTQKISDECRIQMNTRGTFTQRWNREVIWAQTSGNTRNLQKWIAPRALNPDQILYVGSNGSFGSTINVASLFFTKNGLPINDDKTWNYEDRLSLRIASSEDKYKIKPGYTTVGLHFDREPRFYASLGFDGGIWYGNGKYDDANLYHLEMKSRQFLGKQEDGWHPYCGYFVKKLINVTNTATSRTTYTTVNWPWVLLRLGDLYLLYAESMNEADGPNAESLKYLNMIRTKAGIPDVQTSYSSFSYNPDKYTTKEGFRDIIRNERTVDMMFEGERFWDLRRWKLAPIVLNQNIKGWSTDFETPNEYYVERVVYNQRFSLKDYFWPIRERDLINNPNLVQNPGW